ncbi:MAG TPA: hypothetical protein DCX82_10015, partial [Lachnospiraceae bacterium]|nr:hypothetical protein [Lachnospiraceae bacterium]
DEDFEDEYYDDDEDFEDDEYYDDNEDFEDIEDNFDEDEFLDERPSRKPARRSKKKQDDDYSMDFIDL